MSSPNVSHVRGAVEILIDMIVVIYLQVLKVKNNIDNLKSLPPATK